MEKKTPWKSIIITSCVAAVIIPGLYTLSEIVNDIEINRRILAINVLLTFIITFSIFYTNYSIYRKFHSILSWKRNPLRRLIVEFVITSIAAVTIIIIIFFITLRFFPVMREISKHGDLFESVLVALIANFIIVSVVEGNYFFRQWKKSLVETETLKRQHAESKYAVLTNQINPHFLFNSLNALAALIPVDQQKAVEFTNKFSNIYRYVLEVKDKLVVELKDEINFINSYIFLQKIRHGESLQISIRISSEDQLKYILPLSLQLLVENAVKHNEISHDRILNIDITTGNGYLKVKNNFQPRLSSAREVSAGIGLKNLSERYMHFTDEKPEFIIDNDNYIAKIPLIADE